MVDWAVKPQHKQYRYKVGKIILIRNQDDRRLENLYWTYLEPNCQLTRNLSCNQVHDTGPSWPSCWVSFMAQTMIYFAVFFMISAIWFVPSDNWFLTGFPLLFETGSTACILLHLRKHGRLRRVSIRLFVGPCTSVHPSNHPSIHP